PRLLRRFASFRDKVTWLATSVSALAIILVAAVLLTIDYVNMERETVARLQAQTQLVALNSGAPLTSGDRASAHEALQVLQATRNIAAATLFDRDGARFASYRRQDGEVPELAPQPDGLWVQGRWLVLVQPVLDREQTLGRLQVEYDM